MTLRIASLAILALASSLISASAQDILADSGKFVPTLSFTETYTEKPVGRAGQAEIVPIDRFTAKIVANLANFDPTELTSDMPIDISIGDFQFDGTINDLLPLDRSGNPIPLTSKLTGGTYWYLADKLDRSGNPITDRNGNTVQVKVGSLSVSWAGGLLTVNVKILDTNLAGTASIIEGIGLIGMADDGVTGGSLSFANEGVPVSVSFGSASGSRPSYSKGNTKTVYRNVNGDPTPLNSAGITGGADVTGPVVIVTMPANDGGAGTVDFSGTIADLAASTLPNSSSGQFVDVEVYVNDPDFAAPIPADDVSDPDAKGNRTFTYTFVPLDPGTNSVVLVATDDSGNQTIITKSVTSTAAAVN